MKRGVTYADLIAIDPTLAHEVEPMRREWEAANEPLRAQLRISFTSTLEGRLGGQAWYRVTEDIERQYPCPGDRERSRYAVEVLGRLFGPGGERHREVRLYGTAAPEAVMAYVTGEP